VWGLAEAPVPSPHRALAEPAAATSAGDVIEWVEPGGMVRVAVVARGTGKRPRLLTVSQHAEIRRLTPERLPESVARIGRVDLPRPFRPRDAAYRRRVAETLAGFVPGVRVGITARPDEITDPAVIAKIELAREGRRLERSLEQREQRAETLPPGVVTAFRAILGLLQARGYVHGWQLTGRGERLRRVYNALDLVLAEVIDRGWFDDLDGPATAAFASAFTFEPRRDTPEIGWPPGLTERGEKVMELWGEIATAGQPPSETRPPDPGFATIAQRWAAGRSLYDIFGEDDDAAVGDFVRNCRQLIDLVRQIRDLFPDPPRGVHAALRGLDRGVVAAEGAL
jgi:ATP-dependent RNA helicase HelY